MAIQLAKQNSKFNILHQYFYIDDVSDLDIIEDEFKCHMGDIAELSNGTKYQRHSDDYLGELWEYYQGGNSGNSDDNSDDSSSEGAAGGFIIQAVNKVVINTQEITPELNISENFYEGDPILENPQPIIKEGDSCKVTFNNEEYDIVALEVDGGIMLGEADPTNYTPSFENYPFLIFIGIGYSTIITENANSYTIKVEGLVEEITPRNEAALIVDIIEEDDGSSVYSFNKTARQIINALPAVLFKQVNGNITNYGVLGYFNYNSFDNTWTFQIDGQDFSTEDLDDYPTTGGIITQ